jgi:hypothetical protein
MFTGENIKSGALSSDIELLLKASPGWWPKTRNGAAIFLSIIYHITAAYAADILEVEKIAHERLSRDAMVIPLPPIFLAGLQDEAAIRAVSEILAWSKEFLDEDKYLEESYAAAKSIITESGMGRQGDRARYRLRLPARGGGWKVWESKPGAEEELAAEIRPTTPANEKLFFTTLIAELRSKFALDLDPSPSFERGLGAQTISRRRVDYLCVGSSNARRLAVALEARGFTTATVLIPKWKIGMGRDEDLGNMVRDVIEQQDLETIVLQLLDNSTYYVRLPDGSRRSPIQLEDGHYHIDGALAVCTRETQFEHFTAIRQLLDITEKRRCIVISPMPRYWNRACCNEPGHVTNLRDQDYKASMLSALECMRRNLKDFLFHIGRRNTRIVDPVVDIRRMREEEAWGNDPVHPLPQVYAKIAEAINKLSDSHEGATNEFGKRARSNTLNETGGNEEQGQGRGLRPVRGRGEVRGWGEARGRSSRGRGRSWRGGHTY